MSLDNNDLESIEHTVHKLGGDIAVAIGRGFERLEERIDAAESRITSRLSEIWHKIEESQQDLSDELGNVRSELHDGTDRSPAE
jgi:hypothetical protein